MRRGMGLGLVAITLSMLAAGCATEEWTTLLFSKRMAEVDERLADHGGRIDRVEGRVARLEITVTEVREQMREVSASSADPAQKVTPWVPQTSVTEPAPAPSRTTVTVIHVPFGFGRADLDPGAETALSSILTELRRRPGARIELEGATDSVGHYDYNVRLSQRRVAAVQRWLTRKGVERSRITGSTSRGPLADPTVNDAAKRRVVVKLMSPPEK